MNKINKLGWFGKVVAAFLACFLFVSQVNAAPVCLVWDSNTGYWNPNTNGRWVTHGDWVAGGVQYVQVSAGYFSPDNVERNVEIFKHWRVNGVERSEYFFFPNTRFAGLSLTAVDCSSTNVIAMWVGVNGEWSGVWIE